jgi:hypothetical protein
MLHSLTIAPEDQISMHEKSEGCATGSSSEERVGLLETEKASPVYKREKGREARLANMDISPIGQKVGGRLWTCRRCDGTPNSGWLGSFDIAPSLPSVCFTVAINRKALNQ